MARLHSKGQITKELFRTFPCPQNTAKQGKRELLSVEEGTKCLRTSFVTLPAPQRTFVDVLFFAWGFKFGAKFGTKIRKIRGTFLLRLFWPNPLCTFSRCSLNVSKIIHLSVMPFVCSFKEVNARSAHAFVPGLGMHGGCTASPAQVFGDRGGGGSNLQKLERGGVKILFFQEPLNLTNFYRNSF